MSIASEMRELANKNGAKESIENCVAYNLENIKSYAEQGDTRCVIDFYDKVKREYIPKCLRDDVREKLRGMGFTVKRPYETISGVMQVTEYIMW